jgi:chemotaxis protein MotB
MARKKKPEEHANHERWLVSYADFITLLFAFFVVMFAVSQVDSKKMGRFTESFNEALEWQVLNGEGRGLMVGHKPPSDNAASQGLAAPVQARHDYSTEKEAIQKGLAQKASSIPELAGLTVLEIRGELVLRLPERLMFDIGEAAMNPGGKTALEAIADELRARPVRIRIEGHTDGASIRTSKYPSNWELSTARAMAVVAMLLESKKIEPFRLAAAGYGEHHPIASNDSPEGRAQNRRVDIIVVAALTGKETKP